MEKSRDKQLGGFSQKVGLVSIQYLLHQRKGSSLETQAEAVTEEETQALTLKDTQPHCRWGLEITALAGFSPRRRQGA